MSILFIQKASGGEVSTDEVLRTFMEANDLNSIRSSVERAKERLYVTWASVDARDKDGERIPIEQVISEQDKLLQRNGPISDMHSNRQVGQTLAYRVMENPRTKTLGVLHLNQIWGGEIANPLDDQVWKETQMGIRQGSSVGGFNEEEYFITEPDGRSTKVLDGFHQYETASVYRGANPYALNEAVSIVAKSASDFKNKNSLAEAVWSKLEATNTPVNKMAFIEAFNHGIDECDPISKTREVLFRSSLAQEQTETIKKIEPHDSGGTQPMTPDEIQKQQSETVAKMVNEQVNALGASLAKTLSEEIAKQMGDLKKSLEKPVAKEDAPLEGSADAEKPKTPVPAANNDAEVYKTQTEELKKALAEAQGVAKAAIADVKKYSTPRTSSDGQTTPVHESKSIRKTAVDLAMGTTKGSWAAVNKAWRDEVDAQEAQVMQQVRAFGGQ